MAHRCFSSRKLYVLRNEIDVRMLIEETLRIPCRMTEGCFRFLCPRCSGFNTAVNPETNLARCFDCSKNFNTIDLVMLTRQAKFVDSVKFLQSIHQKQSACRDDNPKRRNRSQENSAPCQIRQVIADILPGENIDSPCQSNLDNPTAPHRIPYENRIAKLEHQLEHLVRQIQEITLTMKAVPPEK
jgi:CHC2 zinc finger